MATEITYCMNNPDQERECRIEACPCCGGLGVAARCAGCNGTGRIYNRTKREAELAHTLMFERCEECKGRGFFPISIDLFNRLFVTEDLGIYYGDLMKKPVQRAS